VNTAGSGRFSRRTLSRRRFLGAAGATLAAAAWPERELLAKPRPWGTDAVNANPMIWGYLLHLGLHFWSDRNTPLWQEYNVRDTLRCETAFWREIVDKAARGGVNMVVVDLGEGVQYRSHPELAIKGSWSRDQLREELQRMRGLGIEPIPKINFSTAHDAWLGEYGRMVSTKVYYEVCRDLIAEVVELFDKPRFLHLGMDEEDPENQRDYAYAVIRQHELWWHDLDFYVREVEKAGVRPWVWSDYQWHYPERFYAEMPRSVLQSNWYYGEKFEPTLDRVKTYVDLDLRLYDQIPTGSNWSSPLNFERTVEFCSQYVDRQRLKGFLQTTWVGTVAAARGRHEAAIAQLSRARSAWDKDYSRLQASG
jgi:hypothetical protein